MDIISVTATGRHELVSDRVLHGLDLDYYVVLDVASVPGSAFHTIKEEDGIDTRLIIPKRHKPEEASIYFQHVGVGVPLYVGVAYIVREHNGEYIGFNRAQRRMFSSSNLRLRIENEHDHFYMPFVHDMEVNYTGVVVPSDLLQCRCGSTHRFDPDIEPGIDSIVMVHGAHGTPVHHEAEGGWVMRGRQVTWDEIKTKSAIPVRITF